MRIAGQLVAASVLALSLLVLGATPASACDCHDGGPVCQAFWKTPVIFVGRVVAVEPVVGRDGFELNRVRFRVTEQLRGAPAREIELFTSNTSCDLFFRAGEDWLIYAFPRSNGIGLATGTCSRSQRLQHARADLEYARAAYSRQSDRGRVFGRLVSLQQPNIVPVPGVLISLTYGDRWLSHASAVTDADGRYELLAHPGQYLMSARLPRGMRLLYQPIVNLTDGRGCVEEDVAIDFTGDVTGHVVDHSGAPIANLTIEFIRVDTYDTALSRLRAITDKSGQFAATDVPVGRYKAGIVAGAKNPGGPQFFLLGHPTNPTHEPQFQVEGGNTRALGTVALPKDIRIAHVSGVVVNSEGRPVPGTVVRMKADVDGAEYPWTTIFAEANGSFAFAVVAGTHYRIVAERIDEKSAARRAAIIKVDPATLRDGLRMVIR